MGMGKHHCINRRWINGKFRPVLQAQRFKTLEQPAINENPPASELEQVAGAGNRASAPQKRQTDSGHPFLLHADQASPSLDSRLRTLIQITTSADRRGIVAGHVLLQRPCSRNWPIAKP